MENQNPQVSPVNPTSNKKMLLVILALIAACVLAYWFFAKNPGNSGNRQMNKQSQDDSEVENQEEQPILKQ